MASWILTFVGLLIVWTAIYAVYYWVWPPKE